jgi:hypothetical protein
MPLLYFACWFPLHINNAGIIHQYYVNWGVVEGQQESIVQDIENMVRSFIEKVIVTQAFKIF